MLQRKKAVLTVIAIAALGPLSLAKTTKLTGKVVAYDVTQHSSKNAAALQNQETVVLETTNPKEKYVKVLYSSFGTTQIEPKYFDGTLPLTSDVLREHTCDESVPRLVREVTVEQMGGTYLLTDAYKTQPPGRIKTLKCYVAIYKKKK